MGLRIQNNIAALNAHRWLSTSDTNMSKSMERLSSGFRINRAADDAAGLAISQTFRAEIASLRVASRNIAEGNSTLQVAEGAVDQVSNILTRLKELATQAASANAGNDRDKIDAEAQQLLLEYDDIVTSSKYAGQSLLMGGFGGRTLDAASTILTEVGVTGVDVSNAAASTTYTITATATAVTLDDGAGNSQTITTPVATNLGESVTLNFGSLGVKLTTNKDVGADWSGLNTATVVTTAAAPAASFQVGAENSADNRITVSLGDFTRANIIVGGFSVDLTSIDTARTAMDDVQSVIDAVNGARGDIGAYQNRMGYAAANISVAIENKQASESVIRDVDMAFEMVTFTKNQILLQAGTAMLGQANMAPQNVLSLLGGR